MKSPTPLPKSAIFSFSLIFKILIANFEIDSGVPHSALTLPADSLGNTNMYARRSSSEKDSEI